MWARLRERLEAAARRAMDTPAVAAADAAASEARVAFDLARRAAAGEAVRATRYGALAPRVSSLAAAVDEAEARLTVARRRGAERAAAVETVERIEASASCAPEAEALRRRWQALSEAVQARAAAVEALGALRFDAEADASRTVALAGARSELERSWFRTAWPLCRRAWPRSRRSRRPVRSRWLAGSERSASDAADAAERAVAAVGARLAGEREHLLALSGEDEADCPVCLRPFEGPREALVAEHERRITRLEAELASAEHDRWAARSALDAAREAHARAARAASALEAATRAVPPRAAVGEDLRAAEAATVARAARTRVAGRPPVARGHARPATPRRAMTTRGRRRARRDDAARSGDGATRGDDGRGRATRAGQRHRAARRRRAAWRTRGARPRASRPRATSSAASSGRARPRWRGAPSFAAWSPSSRRPRAPPAKRGLGTGG